MARDDKWHVSTSSLEAWSGSGGPRAYAQPSHCARVSSRPIPPWLLAPVAREHRPPVRPQATLLPVGELDPADFERLCLALAREDGEPEACRLYGTRGQAQDGIDLYARLRNGRYATYQCKRYEKVIGSDIRNAVAAFREGDWLRRSERFVFCTSHAAVRTEHTEEIERQTCALRDDDVAFEVWDAEELSRRLKMRPRIVLDFFGRPWVDAFCTEQLPDRDRLDAGEIARLRARLREFYAGLFTRQDALVDDGTPVSERFVEPDVLRVRHLRQEQGAGVSPEPSGAGDRDRRPPQALTGTVDALLSERVGALEWLQTCRRTLLLGGAGSGKSTLLRWLCLELLAEEPETVGPAARDGAFIAVWLPFGRWVAAIAGGDRDLSLPGLLRRFFAAYAADDVWRLVEAGLHDDRLMLLVDGLDEWSDASAADIAADRLQQYLLQRSLPALAATRPEGLRVLRAVDPEWSTAELAPLSGEQQRRLLERLGAPAPAAAALLRETTGAARLRRLARNPLLLGLMWRLQEGGVALPTDGQAVFAEFIRWLIRTQAPARRRIAEVDDPLDLDGDEVEAALAALALAAQDSPSPALPVAEARRAVAAFLADEAATGLTAPHARTQARLLIEQARGAIGVLSQLDDDHLIFAHRALQEHLAGSALSRLEQARQEERAGPRRRPRLAQCAGRAGVDGANGGRGRRADQRGRRGHRHAAGALGGYAAPGAARPRPKPRDRPRSGRRTPGRVRLRGVRRPPRAPRRHARAAPRRPGARRRPGGRAPRALVAVSRRRPLAAVRRHARLAR